MTYLYEHPAGDKEVEGGGFFVYLRGPWESKFFLNCIMLSFIGTPKRLIGASPGPRRGEEEKEEEDKRTHFIRKG